MHFSAQTLADDIRGNQYTRGLDLILVHEVMT